MRKETLVSSLIKLLSLLCIFNFSSCNPILNDRNMVGCVVDIEENSLELLDSTFFISKVYISDFKLERDYQNYFSKTNLEKRKFYFNDYNKANLKNIIKSFDKVVLEVSVKDRSNLKLVPMRYRYIYEDVLLSNKKDTIYPDVMF